MGEIFIGWRRKLGIVTLVTALGFMSCWVRSQSVGSSVEIPGRNCVYAIQSDTKGLSGTCTWYADGKEISPDMRMTWNWHRLPSGTKILDRRSISNRRCVGFQYEEFTSDLSGQHWRRWTVPYWSIALPLTLFCAYLLLSKPRAARPKSRSENPIPD